MFVGRNDQYRVKQEIKKKMFIYALDYLTKFIPTALQADPPAGCVLPLLLHLGRRIGVLEQQSRHRSNAMHLTLTTVTACFSISLYTSVPYTISCGCTQVQFLGWYRNANTLSVAVPFPE